MLSFSARKWTPQYGPFAFSFSTRRLAISRGAGRYRMMVDRSFHILRSLPVGSSVILKSTNFESAVTRVMPSLCSSSPEAAASLQLLQLRLEECVVEISHPEERPETGIFGKLGRRDLPVVLDLDGGVDVVGVRNLHLRADAPPSPRAGGRCRTTCRRACRHRHCRR